MGRDGGGVEVGERGRKGMVGVIVELEEWVGKGLGRRGGRTG